MSIIKRILHQEEPYHRRTHKVTFFALNNPKCKTKHSKTMNGSQKIINLKEDSPCLSNLRKLKNKINLVDP